MCLCDLLSGGILGDGMGREREAVEQREALGFYVDILMNLSPFFCLEGENPGY